MEYSNSSSERKKGTEFLIGETAPGDCLTPQDYTEEQRMIKSSVDAFIVERILPNSERIEVQEEGLNRSLMKEAGDLGFFSAHIPEKYGGLELDFICETLIAEGMGGSGSFSVSYSAHTGIGILPILYYGTEEQKNKYLPKLGSGEWIASYCLTEPGSGSDALAAKTRADLSADGQSYKLNGQKMWISNAGFADLFIVFAKVEGEKFSCFLVEKATPGLVLGDEEKKMGIKGSSTRQVFFENVTIPKKQLLGEVGKGHLIAFNVLNIGRYKLGASCLGGAKMLTRISSDYARERHQFGKAIAEFGAIKQKIADQMILTHVLEATILRTGGLMEQDIIERKAKGMSYGEAHLRAAEEYALESSILKVFGSEVLDKIVDESVQIHGGMGYSEEGRVARAYRDSRINRIFEGTNEINRLLMLKMIFKKSLKGEIDLAGQAKQEAESRNAEWVFAEERRAINNFRKLLLLLLGYAGQKSMNGDIDLEEAQEPLLNLADIIIDLYTAESLLLRIEKENTIDSPETAILKVYFQDSSFRVKRNAMEFTGSVADDEMQAMLIKAIKKLTRYPLQNTMKLRRRIVQSLNP